MAVIGGSFLTLIIFLTYLMLSLSLYLKTFGSVKAIFRRMNFVNNFSTYIYLTILIRNIIVVSVSDYETSGSGIESWLGEVAWLRFFSGVNAVRATFGAGPWVHFAVINLHPFCLPNHSITQGDQIRPNECRAYWSVASCTSACLVGDCDE